MGSIQRGSDITGKTSPLSTFIEGSRRCSTGITLPRSSCEAVSSFAKASAREFSALGTCLTRTRMNSGFVGVFYLFYHQLGVAAHFQLIYFHGVGKVKSNYDGLIFDLVIGGLEAESEGVFHVYPVWRGQDQTCAAPLGIGGPVHG